MKSLLLAFLVVLSAPAFAETTASQPVPAQPAPTVSAPDNLVPADMKERVALAREYHKAFPVKPRIDATLLELGAGVPPEQKARYFSDLESNLDYAKIEESSIQAMALTFSPEELRKMIAFYTSPEGRRITAKMNDYQSRLQPAVKTALDAAIVKIKYGPTSQKPSQKPAKTIGK